MALIVFSQFLWKMGNNQNVGTSSLDSPVKVVGMWWIFQGLPGTIAATSEIQVDDIDDLESHMLESSVTWESQNMNC